MPAETLIVCLTKTNRKERKEKKNMSKHKP